MKKNCKIFLLLLLKGRSKIEMQEIKEKPLIARLFRTKQNKKTKRKS